MHEVKDTLRAQLRARRKQVPASVAQEAAIQAQHLLAARIDWQTVRRAHLYSAVPALGEISTAAIQSWLAQEHPNVEVVVGDANPSAEMPRGNYDVIIVPVLGFDTENYRLGMGGGWYDRWLATQLQAEKVGLAYKWARLDALPHEAHDIALDSIIEV